MYIFHFKNFVKYVEALVVTPRQVQLLKLTTRNFCRGNGRRITKYVILWTFWCPRDTLLIDICRMKKCTWCSSTKTGMGIGIDSRE